MTDNRIEKIIAEIERLKHQSAIDSDRQAERGLQSASLTSFGKEKACKELLSFIDSIQKEPKECMYSKDNYTDEDRKAICEGCEDECKFNKKEEPTGEGQVKESLISKHEDKTCKENGDSLTQEPVSKDLEKEIDSYFSKWLQGASDEGCFNPDSQLVSIYDCHRIARHFANWQKQKDKSKVLTEEQCRKIRDDAFELGKDAIMQQLMAKAVDATVQ